MRRGAQRERHVGESDLEHRDGQGKGRRGIKREERHVGAGDSRHITPAE